MGGAEGQGRLVALPVAAGLFAVSSSIIVPPWMCAGGVGAKLVSAADADVRDDERVFCPRGVLLVVVDVLPPLRGGSKLDACTKNYREGAEQGRREEEERREGRVLIIDYNDLAF
eukprot:759436-Hanusia_phi.AAC.1